MKTVLGVGVVIVVLGILALLVPVPHAHHESIHAGGFHAGVTTTHDEKLPPAVGAVMVVLGGAMIVAGGRKA